MAEDSDHDTIIPEKISDIFQKYFGHDNGIDLDTSDHHKPHEPMNLANDYEKLKK